MSIDIATLKSRPGSVKVITLHASCVAVYCNRPCLYVGGWVVSVGGSVTRNCVRRSSLNWVCR